MDAQEFRKDFLENVKAEAAATGEGYCAAFVYYMEKWLKHTTHGRRKKMI